VRLSLQVIAFIHLKGISMKSLNALALLVCLAVAHLAMPYLAEAQALPAPDSTSPYQNVFYGQTPAGPSGPVLVFVHGVNGVASDWWVPPNDMYALAFSAGYRTAFISLKPDNTRNNDGIVANATVLRTVMPAIIAHFNVSSVYLVAHSKGGVDAQAAMLEPTFSQYVKAVFTIASPHQGTELADWAFSSGQSMAAGLGLLTPAVAALQTATMAQLRALADPTSMASGIPYYTISGSSYSSPPNALTSATGPILSTLTGQANDGVVTVPRSKLPASYSFDLGTIPANHFAMAVGSVVFPRINAQIRSLEGAQGFRLIATDGFAADGNGNPLPGDRMNSYAWSMRWFKGQLYVGTGRAFLCVGTATNDAAVGAHDYPPAGQGCTPDPKDLPLRAEIWRYTPETGAWKRVYQSPQDVPIEFDDNGKPTKFTARDIAFRGMELFEENDAAGTERLYVGGVSASSLFDQLPGYADPAVRRFPPPRMLWTDDGTRWHEVPQKPGTFLGDVGIQTEITNKRGFRSFAAVRDAHGVNRLFVTLSDLEGVGRILGSSNPSAGNNAWRQVSPSADVLPIFTIHEYRHQLYATATLGGVAAPKGYGIFRSDTVTPDPLDPKRLQFTPAVTPGDMQQFPPRAAISMQEFQGSLYVGSDRPTELIRINWDDSWDLMVGSPRMTSAGMKQPLSGLSAGFNSGFTGHFYSMGKQDGTLYLGTWDWSDLLRGTSLEGVFKSQFGFDFFKTRDGIHWNPLSRNGLGDSFNLALRNIEPTPFGLFLAAADTQFGLQIFQDTSRLDSSGDVIIDSRDDHSIGGAHHPPAKGRHGGRDLDWNGPLTKLDARKQGTGATVMVNPPGTLVIAAQTPSPASVALSWSEAPGARRYHVYRSDPLTFDQIFPPSTTITLPSGQTVTVQDILNGVLDATCQADITEASICQLIVAIRTGSFTLKPFQWIGSTTNLTFSDSPALASVAAPALYYVTAEDSSGHISEPTNMVAIPSQPGQAVPHPPSPRLFDDDRQGHRQQHDDRDGHHEPKGGRPRQ
jgi:hypothetical protein